MATLSVAQLPTGKLSIPKQREAENGRHIEIETFETAPAEFPHPLQSELCWTAESFSPTAPEYVVYFTPEDNLAVDKAIAHFTGTNLAVPMIEPANFPLPEPLAHQLRAASHVVHHGRGFVVLRGLMSETRSDEHTAVAFCGIASYIGRDRAVSSTFQMAMDHLRDATSDPIPKGREHVELSPAKKMSPLKFHADRLYADVLALHVKSKAAIGGAQFLSSFWSIFNEMRLDCPQALAVLMQDFPWPEAEADSEGTCLYAPVVFNVQGRAIIQLIYRVYEGRNLLNPEQETALKQLEAHATRNAIELDVRRGDIQLVNNFAILHARRGWIDSSEQRRHYLRLGLRDPENAWARPVGYEHLFDANLNVPPEEQQIAVTDFDPYGLTSLSADHHG